MQLVPTKILLYGMATVILQTAHPVLAQSASTDNSGAPSNSNIGNAAPPLIRHTPSGQMYTIPAAESEKTFSGSIEVGISKITGDTNNAKFREYQDPRNGAVINNFDFSVEH